MAYVYIIANPCNTVLYIGVTNNIIRRIYEHRNKLMEGFSSKYNLCKLVYFEQYDNITQAIEREKKLKKWNRKWKEDIITKQNPCWKDLYYEICS